jgi:hypothetical protein
MVQAKLAYPRSIQSHDVQGVLPSQYARPFMAETNGDAASPEKMRQLTEVLHRHDHSTKMLATERPGYVVYEDQFQVIAEPFKDTPS